VEEQHDMLLRTIEERDRINQEIEGPGWMMKCDVGSVAATMFAMFRRHFESPILDVPIRVSFFFFNSSSFDRLAESVQHFLCPSAHGSDWMTVQPAKGLLIKRVVGFARPTPTKSIHIADNRSQNIVPIAKLIQQALHDGMECPVGRGRIARG
jgi:hypothetical protein